MKIKFTILLTVIALLDIICPGCTRNNGDIGNLFGKWHLTEITVNGVADPEYEKNIYWGFQNNIILFEQLDEDKSHTSTHRFGTFDTDDSYIILHLDHHGNGQNDYIYNIFPVLRLPHAENVPLRILQDKGSVLRLELKADDGTEIVYNLKKQ